jgi:hypothetical protein
MSDDYLWDGSGTADADTERVERLLGRLRTPLPPAPALAESAQTGSPEGLRYGNAGDENARPLGPFAQRLTSVSERFSPVAQPFRAARPYAGVRFLAPTLAAAAAIVLMVASTWQSTIATRSWEVARMAGQPRVDSAPLADTGRIAIGETLVTDADSRARMHVSTIGQVVVDSDTRVRLVETRRAHHQLALERGTLHAFITAPPGQFVVNTPSSTATDLGCVYTLHVDEDGTGLLSVTAGWVAFEYKGRESFVPAGASSRTDPENGPGTPRYDDADGLFRDALDRLDYGRNAKGTFGALPYVLEHARPKDAMTLWHLIPRLRDDERGQVVDALAARAPMPAGVTRAAVMRLDRASLDLWWDSLGLREATWWRKWKGAYPADR